MENRLFVDDMTTNANKTFVFTRRYLEKCPTNIKCLVYINLELKTNT